jgi:mono/diheme cytochrome c family protein
MKRILILSVFLAGMLGACGTPQAASSTAEPTTLLADVPPEYSDLTNPLGAEAAEAGQAVYKTNCATCHGETGHGDGPVGASLTPRPMNLVVLQESALDDYLFWRISTGKPGTAMVGWKGILTEEQIWQVVALMRTMK